VKPQIQTPRLPSKQKPNPYIRNCSRPCQSSSGEPSRSATIGSETSSIQIEGLTERRAVYATRWEWATWFCCIETQHDADARVSSSGRR